MYRQTLNWGSVPVTVTGSPAEPEVKLLPKHKKNPEVGEKKTTFSSNVIVEQEDAVSFEDNEEVNCITPKTSWAALTACS